MRQTSYVWNELVENGEFHMDAVARIYGATGTDPDAVSGSDSDGSYREYVKITSPVINRSLLSGNVLSIGNCVSGTLNFSIMTTDNIPKSAKIKIMGRVTDGNIEEGNVLSHAGDKIKSHQDDYLSYINDNPRGCDWLTFGTFWIDHRTVDDDFIDLECYDAMKMGNQLYDDPTPSAQWPRAVSTIVTRIAQQIGVSIDSRTTKYFTESGLWGQKIVTMPTSDTLNDILGHIGGILGGNWYITEENKLRYIPLISAPVDAGHILSHANDKITTDQGDYIIHGSIRTREADRDGGHITSHVNDKIVSHVGDYIMWETLSGLNTIVNLGGTGCVVVPVIIGSMTTADSVSITRVTVSVNADTTYSYGVDGGFELIVSENPYATDALTAALYERVKGVVYSPYNITTAVYNPATELGDWVIAGNVVSSTIFTQNIRIGIGFDADISAPGENELENEFPYKTIEQKVTEKIETTETTLRQETASAVESATNQITGANGSQIQFLYDENKIMKEIVIMDTNSTSTAQKVWRWNGNGFGYSKNGYNGPFGLAITQDGAIVADFVYTGILQSPSNSNNLWNLDTGEFKVQGKNETGTPALYVDPNTGLTTINASKITAGQLMVGQLPNEAVRANDNISRLNNDSGYQNASQVTVITNNAISTANLNADKIKTGIIQAQAKTDLYKILSEENEPILSVEGDNLVYLPPVNTFNRWNLDTGEFRVGKSNDDYAIWVRDDGRATINASKITTGTFNADGNSVKIRGKLTDWNNSNNNYWNLDTGDFQVKGSSDSDYAIKVSNGKTDINATNITTGTLKTQNNNNNYWNLTNGTFKVQGTNDNAAAIEVNSSGKAIINAGYITTGTLDVENRISIGAISKSKLSSAVQRSIDGIDGAAENVQTIYYSKATNSGAPSAQTTWVTDATGGQNKWTTTRPVYSSSYPLLFVAKQTQTVAQSQAGNNVCTCTTPVLDQTTTVIDGGRITTGQINADRVRVGRLETLINNRSLNYWDLETGDFQVMGANESNYAIKVSNGITNINATNITTGTLKNKNNSNNFWNLTNGTFKVQGANDSSAAIEVNSNGNAVINASRITVGTIDESSEFGGNFVNIVNGKIDARELSANKITTGTISSQSGNTNYWNLSTGQLRIGTSDSDYAIYVNSNGVATINADKITTGTLTIGGTSCPSIVINDSNDAEIGRWDKDGIEIKALRGNGLVIKDSDNNTNFSVSTAGILTCTGATFNGGTVSMTGNVIGELGDYYPYKTEIYGGRYKIYSVYSDGQTERFSLNPFDYVISEGIDPETEIPWVYELIGTEMVAQGPFSLRKIGAIGNSPSCAIEFLPTSDQTDKLLITSTSSVDISAGAYLNFNSQLCRFVISDAGASQTVDDQNHGIHIGPLSVVLHNSKYKLNLSGSNDAILVEDDIPVTDGITINVPNSSGTGSTKKRLTFKHGILMSITTVS